MACKILSFSDAEGLAKSYFSAWKSGKVCLTHENWFSKRLLLSSERLSHHCPIQHFRDRVFVNEESKRGKNALKEFVAAETLNSIATLSLRSQQEESYLNVFLLGELNNFLHDIMVKIEALVF